MLSRRRHPEPDRPTSPADGTVAMATADLDRDLAILGDQLRRMRSMLFGYSERFYERVRTWGVLSVVLLLLSGQDPFRPAAAVVTFLVPFAFLETGYLFFHTVFARRHAERLEQAINDRLGREVLAAHRLEAAYFYPPSAPKVAAFSLGRPDGFPTLMTLGYALLGLALWVAGLTNAIEWALSVGGIGLSGLVVPAALVWTGFVVAVLLWVFLGREDERRLERALETSYRLPD
jgi:hypothetical protein